MSYEDFIKAVEIFGIISTMSKKDIKKRYLKLSKKYHPDVEGGSNEKFMELKKAYDTLQEYMENYSYSFEIDDFKKQFPSFTNYKNWVK
ncbi:DnaJ domain-containing protein [Aliarcobacter skirrowii]|jgi:DnaJ-class molecular chaperone|uniref:DnaJ domain-containing protein n=1 Tax=Aliarcobacter skirrowii TaxID=28200 RepID=A0A2U2C021_9BACT|nr:DnaJ domain-containing protein [Aliarcobacter skirrowii]MCT7446135.1 DnaJ domain-containing protein [Aliarcobacter skirrowii]MDD2509138.1 DnaJ domain-containing protein [Aliarcobacter skirrowii]MDD3497710.1 DnaJ domain-containing protein [Aliarcobacter skirrowii]MDX4025251.1 DnaJ domain-containing protein [Aliarcobacter skirrowii]MDX4035106.1 DnaJ domain-containing protein [Aliarcobacter skirrowii]